MVDLSSDHSATLSKKIRSAQLAQYNYTFGEDIYREARSDQLSQHS